MLNPEVSLGSNKREQNSIVLAASGGFCEEGAALALAWIADGIGVRSGLPCFIVVPVPRLKVQLDLLSRDTKMAVLGLSLIFVLALVYLYAPEDARTEALRYLRKLSGGEGAVY